MQILNKTTDQSLLLRKYKKTQLIAYSMYLPHFVSNLYRHLNRSWANQLNIFITSSTKVAVFITTHLKKYYMTYRYQQESLTLNIKRHERFNAN